MKVKKLDLNLIIIIFIFLIISLLSIYTSHNFVNINNITIKQLIFYIIGFIVLYIAYYYKNEIIKYASLWYIGLNILLLVLLFFGISVNGSRCWLFIGPFSFQPSEFMKISLIILIAKILNQYNQELTMKEELFMLLKIFIILLIPSILTFLEPDTGVVIIYFIITISMIFIKGISRKWYIIFGLFILIILSLIIILYLFKRELFINLLGSNIFYRIERILNWSNQIGYQLENSLVVIATSSVVGNGLNNIPLYFPEASTDFIFTSYTSIFGLIGDIFLILVFILFNSLIISLYKKRIPIIDKYILIGILSMILYQEFQNISMTIGIMPITGITLPFISYGGSSLLSYMFIVGLILRIIKERQAIN